MIGGPILFCSVGIIPGAKNVFQVGERPCPLQSSSRPAGSGSSVQSDQI